LQQAGLNLTTFYQEPRPQPLRSLKVLINLILLGVVYIFSYRRSIMADVHYAYII